MKDIMGADLGDITKVSKGAIVNAANTSLLGGSGVDGAIHKAAGPELLKECEKLNGCETGGAKLTKAYRIPCEAIIHTVGPIWNGGGYGEAELLASCYRSSLEVARENGIRYVTFPSISTGIFGYPLKPAAKLAVRTVGAYLKEHPDAFDRVVWTALDDKVRAVYADAIDAYEKE